ncbi:MAG: TonB-dependent receptor [Vicinamibacterales bacterium]
MLLITCGALMASRPLLAQDTGTIRGQVVFEDTGGAVHGATVIVMGPGASTATDEEGRFELSGVPTGSYEVVAQREHLSTLRQRVSVASGQTAELTFRLRLQPLHEELNVTASPTGTATNFEAFSSIQSLDSFELARAAAPTLANAVAQVPGVEIRSFGPGSARPIIRGFDGDRVLVLQDGIRAGDLSSQSGDHGTTIDPASLERIEVVRGPATLLYGSNAVGGLVHAVTPQESFRRTPVTGLRGQVLTEAGNNNGQAAGNVSLQYGDGNWLFWAGGGARRLGDYTSPLGPVLNSSARQNNGRVGIGYMGSRAFFSAGYEAEDGRYGIPFAGELHAHGDKDDHDHEAEEEGHDEHADHDHADDLTVDIAPRRHNLRVDFGVRDLNSRIASAARLIVSRSDWRHDELETDGGVESLGTRFDNDVTNVRLEVDQQRVGRLSGRFGASGEFRDFVARGEEALAPATTQRALGVFGYEQLDLGRARLMFGGRVESTAYNTIDRAAASEAEAEQDEHDHADEGFLPPAARDRTFTGGSGAVGLHVGLGGGTALVTTVTRSFRAPALEELYNFGPHVGILAFEVGNTNLGRESTLGWDVSLRHRSTRARGEFNAFVYDIDNFVFASASSDVVDGLFVARYLQGDSRFAGVDGQASVNLGRRLWATVGLGYVNARLTAVDEYVPRVPPLRTRVSIDVPIRSVTVGPELVVAGRQDRLFRTETATAGYTLLNLNASYVVARSHAAHVINFSGLNLTNELYRRHTSFIKDLAAEMGRAVRVSYSIRFF